MRNIRAETAATDSGCMAHPSELIWSGSSMHKSLTAKHLPPYGAGNVPPGIPIIAAGHSLFLASCSGLPTAYLAVILPKRVSPVNHFASFFL